MNYISYKGTPYEKQVHVPSVLHFNGKRYEMEGVFANYGSHNGHREAVAKAKNIRDKGYAVRVVARSGFTVLYIRDKNKR